MIESDSPAGLWLARSLFDSEFYVKSYGGTLTAGGDLFEEYVQQGWRQGRDPNSRFNTRSYLAQNPDVVASGECPLLHYARIGAAEGRHPRTFPLTQNRTHIASFFDLQFYLSRYPDVVKAGVDPLDHYLSTGWKEGRNPRADFDTCYYLGKYPDVAALGECPLQHYVRIGQKEGRRTCNRTDVRRTVIAGSTSPRARSIHWRREFSERIIDPWELRSALEGERATERTGLVLCLSHDDYAVVIGGVQNCVGDEQVALNKAGWSYVHIHPTHPLPMLADPTPTEKFLVGIRVNGRPVGTATFESVVQALADRKEAHLPLYIIVHHLLGFSPELVVEAAERLGPDEVVFWQHDFFSLCPNPALLRNDAQFCYGPPLDSPACSVCVYGEERREHFTRMSAAFSKLQPTVISPSKTAAEFWSGRQIHSHRKMIVIPHGRVALAPPTLEHERGVLRVGFVGAPLYHKGWHAFEDLAANFAGDPRYSFYHLGSPRPASVVNVEHIEVSCALGGRNAMTEAVYEREIDVVVNWSLCYETFSFTAHEALAGGAFLVVRREAGNVWPAVELVDARRGCAVEDERTLHNLFATGEIRRLARSRRPGLLSLSGCTADYILSEMVASAKSASVET